MQEMFLFILGSIGLAHILVDGAVFAWLRNWLREPTIGKLDFMAKTWPAWIVNSVQWFVAKASEMIQCHQCCGFWTGLVCSWLAFNDISGWQMLAGGFAGSFLSMFFAILFNYLEAQTIVKLPPNDPPPSK